MSTQKHKALTSLEWWALVKNDPARLADWLADQYHGEVTAQQRIVDFANQYAPEGNHWRATLLVIAGQESDHAAWVGELLIVRGLRPRLLVKQERYWERTLPAIDSFESGAAVAARAEAMRLERIRVIAADPEAPPDIREVFERILPQEEFHARAFAQMAGKPAMAAALSRHEAGMEAIGLIPAGI